MSEILLDGPNWKKGKPEETAILVLPGMYQEYRITEGTKFWPDQGEYLWVAGTNGDPAYSRKQIISVIDVDYPNDLHYPNIICGEFARHTLDQMEWCVSLLKENTQVKHLIVTTAAYHLPRCTLTLLQVLTKSGMKIPITPLSIRNPSGDSFSPTSTEDLRSEVMKIQQYQEKGDVASLDTWRNYINWRIS